MNKFFLILAAIAATEAKPKGLVRANLDQANGELRGLMKKSSNDDVFKEAPSCSSGKGKGGKGGKGGCKTPTIVVCEGLITDEVTLAADLACYGAITALTVDGPEAVLDCDGNMIFREGTPYLSDGSIGILLMNGAKAINCLVKGFTDGVYMDGGDNTLEDSILFLNQDGVQTSGDGCMTIENVQSISNAQDGIVPTNTGTLVVKGSSSIGNGSDGIFSQVSGPGTLLLALEDILLASNDDDGFNNDAYSAVTTQVFGSSKIIDNGDEGIELEAGTVTFVDEATIINNDADGIDLQGGIATFDVGSSVSVCDNRGQDLDGAAFTDLSAGGLVCDVLQNNVVGINCVDCPVDETAAACLV